MRARAAAADLTLEGVTVRYDDVVAVDGVDLEVGAGEIVAVVGPSGSGKSTLLRAVAGLEPLTEGRVLLGGRDLAGVPTHHRGLGLMFQDHGLFTHLDVVGNIGYGLTVAGTPEPQRQARVDELLRLVGLEEMSDRRVDQLSGGEAQRVALARALAPAPGLLMLDEPLGSLDRALREQLVGELRRLLTELGQTALHVTHDQGEAFALADRAAILDRGRLEAIGRPAELWADPGSRFVAQFLGHPNIWTVTVGLDGTVRSGGVELGRVGPGHELASARPDPIDVVVPVSGVGQADGAEPGVEAIVEQVTFERGIHRVAARLVGASIGGDARGGGDPSAQRSAGPLTTFCTEAEMTVGDHCRLRIDLTGIRALRKEPADDR